MSYETLCAYPAPEQAARWRGEAEAADMNQSEFIISMVEAGLKKFTKDAAVESHTLKKQRDHYRGKLNECRDARERLEDDLRDLESEWHQTDYAVAKNLISENPGVTYDRVLDEVQRTAPERVSNHLDMLAGSDIRVERRDETGGEREYYPLDPDADDDRRGGDR